MSERTEIEFEEAFESLKSMFPNLDPDLIYAHIYDSI